MENTKNIEEIKSDLEELRDVYAQKGMKLSFEERSQIKNRLTAIQLSAEKMAAEKENIYKLTTEIRQILQ